ncbi:MAG: hypothetical protein AABZ57_04785, partial [Candidatus Margulisiibacteriota bacterium]
FEDLREIAKELPLRQQEFQRQEKNRRKEEQDRRNHLRNEFNHRVKSVYCQFSKSIGRRTDESSQEYGDRFEIKLTKKDFGLFNVQLRELYPKVNISYGRSGRWGIIIVLPYLLGSLSDPYHWNEETKKLQSNPRWTLEGIYIDDESGNEGPSYYKVYFIPFEVFTEEKLASKLYQFYTESVKRKNIADEEVRE